LLKVGAQENSDLLGALGGMEGYIVNNSVGGRRTIASVTD